MSNNTKKQEELTSLNAFTNNCLDPLAKHLLCCENISLSNQERPDIVLSDSSAIYAIEHISIPMLQIGNGNADRIRQARTKKVYNKYYIDPNEGTNNLEGHEHEVLNSVESIVNEQLGAISDFSYVGFIDTCRNLLYKHNAQDYVENVSKWFSGKEIKVFFLLDFAYPKVFEKGLLYKRTNKATHEFSVRKDFPFTNDFLNVLYSVQGVNCFFIAWHPENTYDKKQLRCYLIDCINIDKSLQHIPQVWDSFNLPINRNIKQRVKLVLEGKE